MIEEITMTTVTTISIILTAVLAFLLGRSMYINSRRATRISNLTAEIKKFQDCFELIAGVSNFHRFYEIVDDKFSCNVIMKVYLRLGFPYASEHVYCNIKSFPFANNKGFAHNEAKKLLEKLKEK